MAAFDPSVVDDPIPPGPHPIPPGPGRPEPVPDPGPAAPWPDPQPEPDPRPDDDDFSLSAPDVVVELRGSVAVLSGVVERAEDRESIGDQVGSLAGISQVENNLRPPAA